MFCKQFVFDMEGMMKLELFLVVLLEERRRLVHVLKSHEIIFLFFPSFRSFEFYLKPVCTGVVVGVRVYIP